MPTLAVATRTSISEDLKLRHDWATAFSAHRRRSQQMAVPSALSFTDKKRGATQRDVTRRTSNALELRIYIKGNGERRQG